MPVVTMAVTHTEEVAVAQLEHVRIGKVCILVLFVGIVRGDSTFGCERKLSDRVADFFNCLFGCLAGVRPSVRPVPSFFSRLTLDAL